jgi:hypothetical protein
MNTTSHPSTLVIGDVHHRIDAAHHLIAKYSARCQRTVFLGDYFDAFGDGPREMRATCQWLRRSLKDPNRTHLLGNHDLAYLLPQHEQAWCPGWTPNKQQVFDEEMAAIGIGSFRVACQVGPWLLSHAGIHGERLDTMGTLGLLGQIEREFASACSGNRSWLFGRGPDRGGYEMHGGILWLDWNGEFSPTAGFHQIVGHTATHGVARAKCLKADGAHRAFELVSPATSFSKQPLPQPGPEFLSVNWNLDTLQKYAGVIEAGRLELVVA